MRLKILLPYEVFLDDEADKIVAEAENGSFGLLPRHIDFVTALTAGILSYIPAAAGGEVFVAVDEGVLVKRGADVVVSTRRAVRSAELATLEMTVERDFHALTDDERRARSALARLETTLARRFFEFHSHD